MKTSDKYIITQCDKLTDFKTEHLVCVLLRRSNMMFHQQLVAAIRVNGKILREFGDKVYLKFGSEYSILVKNQSSLRAEVKISIDGNDVLNGSSLVVDANSSIDLERFIKDNHKGNRLKFIERTSSVEQHRGIKIDDGLVRIEWQFEKQPVKIEQSEFWYKLNNLPTQPPWSPGLLFPAMVRTTVTSTDAIGTTQCRASVSTQNAVFTSSTASDGTLRSAATLQNDVGITAPGSISNQKFETVLGLDLDPAVFSMVIQLCGETEENKKVVAPVTVKQKPVCVTCNRTNKASSKFCSNCGTSLQIV